MDSPFGGTIMSPLRKFLESIVFAGMKPGTQTAAKPQPKWLGPLRGPLEDRKRTRLNSRTLLISYAVFFFKEEDHHQVLPFSPTRLSSNLLAAINPGTQTAPKPQPKWLGPLRGPL